MSFFLRWQVIGHEEMWISERISSQEVVRHWNRLPSDGMESPALEIFKKLVNVALRDIV